MVTSRSNRRSRCIGGALIFSGRADPTWPVNDVAVAELRKTWDLLAPTQGAVPAASLLGYRGCFLRLPSGLEWTAHKGVVTLKTDDQIESRRDVDRKFEKMLLETAPEGVLPTPLIKDE